MVTNGEQPGNVPVKVNPPTWEGWQHWTKELKKKGTSVPTLREIFSFQCPCLSPPTIEGMCCGSNFYLVQNVSNQFSFQFFIVFY